MKRFIHLLIYPINRINFTQEDLSFIHQELVNMVLEREDWKAHVIVQSTEPESPNEILNVQLILETTLKDTETDVQHFVSTRLFSKILTSAAHIGDIEVDILRYMTSHDITLRDYHMMFIVEDEWGDDDYNII